MAASHELGRRAEQAAADHLAERGWTILAANWRSGHREIDLVVERAGIVAFVEVKCRASTRYGLPEAAVTWAKRRDLAAAARAWIALYGRRGRLFRFDLCAVRVRPDGGLSVAHLEDAWRL